MSQEFNLNLLKELEQDIVLNVLCRDEILRKLEEQRVRYVCSYLGMQAAVVF